MTVTDLQIAQTSALTDRQGEERRIVDLENTVRSVSAILFQIFSSINDIKYLALS